METSFSALFFLTNTINCITNTIYNNILYNLIYEFRMSKHDDIVKKIALNNKTDS